MTTKTAIRSFAFSSWALLFSLVPTLCFATVPQRALADEAWIKTYQAVVQQLGGLWVSKARTDFAMQSGLERDDAALILRYLLNYDVSALRIDDVMVRYPHYTRTAIQDDVLRLAELGLIESSGPASWAVTGKGVAHVDRWYEIAAHESSQYESVAGDIGADFLLDVLNRLVSEAAGLDDGGINTSIISRINHRFRVADDAPLLQQIDERVWDYIAFINDNAHYAMDRYSRAQPGSVPDSILSNPLAKELLAAMRGQRRYALSRCIEHPIWRNGGAACADAIQTLRDLGWVTEVEAGVFMQSETGAGLFDEIDALSAQRLYQTWSVITPVAYDAYLEILDRIPDVTKSESDD